MESNGILQLKLKYGKRKSEKFAYLAQRSLNRNIVINDIEYKFYVYQDVKEVIDTLSQLYDLKYTKRDIERFW